MPFALLKNELLQKWSTNLIVGITGFIFTSCIFLLLFNYRRRENIIEESIIHIEKTLKLRGLIEIRERIQKKPFFKGLPNWTQKFHKNRLPMGIIFLVLWGIYGAILLAQL